MRMIRLFLLTSCVLWSCLALYGQKGTIVNNGSKSLALGGIHSILNGEDALLNNFAAIVDQESISALVSSERRFGLSQLTSAVFGVHIPIQNFGHFGIVGSSYGFDSFRENKLSIAYARKITRNLSISANMDYNTLRIQSFGSKSFLSFGIGIYGSFMKDLHYGVYIFNPEKTEIAEATQIPGFIQFSISKYFNSGLSLYSEIEKTIDEAINFKLGVAYNVFKQVELRLGYNTSPGGLGFGLAYKVNKNIAIEGGSLYNTLLGMTPGITVKYKS